MKAQSAKIFTNCCVMIALSATFTLAADAMSFSFPDAGSSREKATFCISANKANTDAMNLAAGMIKSLGKSHHPADPQGVIKMAGGLENYQIALERAREWDEHAKSLAQTHYYPIMSGDGDPYTVQEGQLLLAAFLQCLNYFQQITK